ncbi:sensor histidine kinase [Saccharospirillum salsuginis]|uniref:histidine kinase n=1 Tax=Saccharospirillum salsuginis TaxID=418750 RepID=A0A918N544_9GAMM|nr:HAMP domain-containing sensor histidine kinase [Saccharospirillum salsuginis]GGX37955.1 two-component sensor histidine kinase [Saccharospirillum salsuginis]
MWPIFTKIYLWWLAVLIVLCLAVYGVIDRLNQHRFERFAERQAEPALTLIREGLERHTNGREAAWLEITASLTGVGWQIVEEDVDALRVDEASWQDERARLTVPIRDDLIIQGLIQDWEQLATGIGLLTLNELSLTDADQREQRLTELQHLLGLELARVGWENEGLGFVDERNLARGQVIVQSNYALNQFMVYVPAGAEQALRVGPFDQFQWLTVGGITVLVLALLITLAIALILVLLPLQRRLGRLTQAVDRIAEQGRTEPLPRQPQDGLTTMWRHVNAMAQRLIDLADQSQQLNQAVSHDLKTPLARMTFALEMLDSDSDPLIGNLKTDVRELNQLLDELLTFHQLSQSTPTEPHYCFPRAELDRLLEGPIVRDVRVSKSLDGVHRAPIEEHHWRRLCRNLVTNAVQYGNGHIDVRLEEDLDGLRLAVGDNGQGFSEELKDRAFEPFVRGDRARNLNSQGHGMGLALCQTIVQYYGGRLTINQSHLGGAQIDVWLPTVQDVDTSESPRAETEVQP